MELTICVIELFGDFVPEGGEALEPAVVFLGQDVDDLEEDGVLLLGLVFAELGEGLVDVAGLPGEFLAEGEGVVEGDDLEEVQGLLYQGPYLVVALAQTLQAPDQGQVQPQRFVRVEPVKSADVVAGPDESIVFDDFVLDPQEAPDCQNHGVPIGLVEHILDRPQG